MADVVHPADCEIAVYPSHERGETRIGWKVGTALFSIQALLAERVPMSQHSLVSKPSSECVIAERASTSLSYVHNAPFCMSIPTDESRHWHTVPPAEDARRRLILHIEHLPIVSQSAYRGTSALLLHHSFSLMEQDCVVQLERIGDMFQYLFGVLGDTRGEGEGVRAFDALFESEHDNGRQSPLRSSAASNASSDTESDAR